MDALRIHAKNGRINLDARFVILLIEFSMITLDIICFSEMRLETRDEFIEGSHHHKNARTSARGMQILVYR